jgi:hypothetical protein
MSKSSVLIASLSILAATGLAGQALGAQSGANFAGNWRCQPEPDSCNNSGTTFTVTQMGNNLDVKNDKGAVGQGTVTSNITISMGPPWNMLGVVAPDNSIQWSNGTTWRKQ